MNEWYAYGLLSRYWPKCTDAHPCGSLEILRRICKICGNITGPDSMSVVHKMLVFSRKNKNEFKNPFLVGNVVFELSCDVFFLPTTVGQCKDQTQNFMLVGWPQRHGHLHTDLGCRCFDKMNSTKLWWRCTTHLDKSLCGSTWGNLVVHNFCDLLELQSQLLRRFWRTGWCTEQCQDFWYAWGVPWVARIYFYSSAPSKTRSNTTNLCKSEESSMPTSFYP